MNFPKDIKLRIERDYLDEDDRKLVYSLLLDLDVNEKLRVVRCILFSANGDIDSFGKLEALAKRDYRDVIMVGEYEYPSERRLRDFNEPFIIR